MVSKVTKLVLRGMPCAHNWNTNFNLIFKILKSQDFGLLYHSPDFSHRLKIVIPPLPPSVTQGQGLRTQHNRRTAPQHKALNHTTFLYTRLGILVTRYISSHAIVAQLQYVRPNFSRISVASKVIQVPENALKSLKIGAKTTQMLSWCITFFF